MQVNAIRRKTGSSTAQGEITRLLAAVREGQAGALDRLMTRVYDELHKMAHRQLRSRRPGQTLDTTALVHEAYFRLVEPAPAGWKDRRHFMAVAATAMRQILVDHARRRGARKRGGDDRQVLLEERMLGVRVRSEEMLAVDQALRSLAKVDERLVRLVELRFFGGLTVAETARVLEVSEPTVKRDWRKARAFLFRSLQPQSEA